MSSFSATIPGYRTVCHLPGSVSCVDCYLTSPKPCENCSKIDYELKTDVMPYEYFAKSVGEKWLEKKCSKVPESYEEFCELYEMFHDMPDLIDDDGTVNND